MPRTVISLEPEDKEDIRRLLEQTRGLWRADEGLAYQTRVREEWGERP